MRRLREKVTYANVMATIAVFVALSGGAIAATQLEKNTVGNNQVKKGAITFDKLKPGIRHRLRGRTGPQGPQGPQGSPGTPGEKGDQGNPGPPGNANTFMLVGTPQTVTTTGPLNLAPVALPNLGAAQLTVEVDIDQIQGSGAMFVSCGGNLTMSGNGHTRPVTLGSTSLNPANSTIEGAVSAVQLVDSASPQSVVVDYQCQVIFSGPTSVVLTPRVGVVGFGSS